MPENDPKLEAPAEPDPTNANGDGTATSDADSPLAVVTEVLSTGTAPAQRVSKVVSLLLNPATRWMGGGLAGVIALPNAVLHVYFYLQNASQLPGLPGARDMMQAGVFAAGATWFASIGYQVNTWMPSKRRWLWRVILAGGLLTSLAYCLYRSFVAPHAERDTVMYRIWPGCGWMLSSILAGLLTQAAWRTWVDAKLARDLHGYSRAATVSGLLCVLILVGMAGYDLSLYPTLSPPRRARLTWTPTVQGAGIPQDTVHRQFTVPVLIIHEGMSHFCVSFYLEPSSPPLSKWLPKDKVDASFEGSAQPGQFVPGPSQMATPINSPTSEQPHRQRT
jgi:hypothetical protein